MLRRYFWSGLSVWYFSGVELPPIMTTIVRLPWSVSSYNDDIFALPLIHIPFFKVTSFLVGFIRTRTRKYIDLKKCTFWRGFFQCLLSGITRLWKKTYLPTSLAFGCLLKSAKSCSKVFFAPSSSLPPLKNIENLNKWGIIHTMAKEKLPSMTWYDFWAWLCWSVQLIGLGTCTWLHYGHICLFVPFDML